MPKTRSKPKATPVHNRTYPRFVVSMPQPDFDALNAYLARNTPPGHKTNRSDLFRRWLYQALEAEKKNRKSAE